MAKNRNIILCVILSFVTCGIYSLYWFVKLTDETNYLAADTRTAGGGMALVLTLITCNLYGWYWAYKMGQKIDTINGNTGGNTGILYIILQALGLGIVNYCLVQDCINKQTEDW